MNFGPVGIQEIIIIVIVIAVIFGPRQLPAVSKKIAKTVQSFRKEVRELKDDIDITK